MVVAVEGDKSNMLYSPVCTTKIMGKYELSIGTWSDLGRTGKRCPVPRFLEPTSGHTTMHYGQPQRSTPSAFVAAMRPNQSAALWLLGSYSPPDLDTDLTREAFPEYKNPCAVLNYGVVPSKTLCFTGN